VLSGLRGEDGIAELCRREGIVQNLYYRWSKGFLEAGKKRLAGDTERAVTAVEEVGGVGITGMILSIGYSSRGTMRGSDKRPGELFWYVDLEKRIRSDHPLRAIRALTDSALAALSGDFAALYSGLGRSSAFFSSRLTN
jgi:hypothetical protein